MSDSSEAPRPTQNGAGRPAASDSGDENRESTLNAILRNYPALQDRQSVARVIAGGLPLVIENLPLEPLDTPVEAGEPAVRLRPPESRPARPQSEQATRFDQPPLAGHPLDLALLPVPDPFVDRTIELGWLRSRLTKDWTRGTIAVCGMGGIGKTGLVAKAVHEVSEEGWFRDGIAVVLCQNARKSEEILKGLLVRFGAERREPDDTDLRDLRDEVARFFARRDALIVLDNVEMELDIEAVVAPFRATIATILLTAREVLPASLVPKSNCLLLELLSPEQALELFAQSYGKSGTSSLTAAERVAAQRIVGSLGCHTLAIRLAGAYAVDVHRDLAALATDLEDPQRAIALTADGREQSVAVVFQESLRNLEPREADLFAALSVFNGPDFGRHAAIALAAGLARGELAVATVADEIPVDRLVRRALLSASMNESIPPESDRERLNLHPLLCIMASEKLNGPQWTDQRRRLVSRLVASYFISYGRGKRVPMLAPDESNIHGALKSVHEQEQADLVVALCLTMRRFWLDGWRTHDSLRYLEWGTDAAEGIVAATPTTENRLNVADLLRTYGQVLRRAGRLDAATEKLQRALAICQEENDAWREASTLSQLGRLAWAQAHLDDAYDYFIRSSATFRGIGGDRRREGANLGYLGRIAQARGKLKDAQSYYQESLSVARAVGDRHGERLVLFDLGQVALARGEMKEAERYFEQSMVICKEEHDHQGESDILTGKGRIALNRREFEAARGYFQESLAICEEVGDRQSMGVNFSQLGQVALESGQLDVAEQYVRESLIIRKGVKDLRGEGVDVSLLARIALRRGQLDEAKEGYEEAQRIAREVGNRRGEGVNHYYLAVIAEAYGDFGGAEAQYRDSVRIAGDAENGPDIARAQLALGRVLIEQHGDHQQGDPLVVGAAQRLDELELPEAESAHELARELGAERVKREPIRMGISSRFRGFGRRELREP